MNQNLNSGSSAGLPVCLKRAQPSFRPTTPDGEHSTADSGQPTSAPQTHCVQSAQPSRLWLPFNRNHTLARPSDPLINTAAFSPVLPICAISPAVSTAYRPSRTHLPQFCNSQPTASTPLSRYLQITHKHQKT